MDALLITIKLSKSSDDIVMVIDKQFGVTSNNMFNGLDRKVKPFAKFYINDSPECRRIISELELEVQDYINQWVLLEREAKCLNGIKVK